MSEEGRPMPGAPLNLAEPRNSELSLLATPGCECSDTSECGACGGARIEAYCAEIEARRAEALAEQRRRVEAWPAYAATVQRVPVEDERVTAAPTLSALGRSDLVDGLSWSNLLKVEEAVAKAVAKGDDRLRDEIIETNERELEPDEPAYWPLEAKHAWPYRNGECPGDARLAPEFWRGLEGRDDEVEAYTRRMSAYHATYGYGAGRPLAPGYLPSDLRVEEYNAPLTAAAAGRAHVLLDSIADRHDEHWYYAVPVCRKCYGDALARARLVRWLVANGGTKTPPLDIPTAVPGDEVEVELAPEARRSPYLSLDDLINLTPAPMLVADVLPAGSYGVLRGRDGTKKSFLALDLAMHLAAPRYDDWHGGRTVDPVNYGRALYIVGEGVQGFGRRVLGWLAEHNLTPADLYPDSLTLRHGTVDLYAGGPEFDALITKVRELEPDLVVIDTLARSSGSADANSATDTSVMLRRVDQIKEACNGGTVLVVAHTTKGDTDSRGSSVIEDDADFVLAVEATDTVQTLTVAKMKDGPSGQKITLGLASVEVDGDTTLVLRDARPDSGPLLTEEASTRQHVEGALFATRDLDPLTRTEITTRVRENGKDVSRQSVDKALGALVAEGAVVQAGKRGSSAVYRLAEHRFPTWAQS